MAILAAGFCAWLSLCLLFWQGSWQLLYHPAAAIAHTPDDAHLAYEPVAFATTEAGVPRLKGWWIPAEPEAAADPELAAATGADQRLTVLYLHGQTGNLGDTVPALAALNALGVNVLAFDYRGYGDSQSAHPSEASWREDAEWALQYLTATRHVAAGTILLDGQGLGANLALEVAASHPELAGVVLESPVNTPADAILKDPRARLVPARWLVSDRWDAVGAAARVRVPSLWFAAGSTGNPAGYDQAPGRKMLVWLKGDDQQGFARAFKRWLDDLPGSAGGR